MKIGNFEVDGAVFLAPMAGITDPSFRKIVQGFGVSAVWTEMLAAKGLVSNPKVFPTMNLDGHVVPTVFQIYGKDPAAMGEAARVLEGIGAPVIDINMGCPARKVVFKGSGAALMQNIPLAAEIMRSVRQATTRPVTVKMRSGWDEQQRNAPEFARIMEAEGADALIVHARSRSVRHSGPVSMEILREVKESVSVPVIGNGGVSDPAEAMEMVALSGCDGVMVARGALGRPWAPGRILKALTRGPLVEERLIPVLDVIRTHYRYQIEYMGEVRAVFRMRKHLAWYSKGLEEGTEFRRRMFREEDPEAVMRLVEQWFEGVTALA